MNDINKAEDKVYEIKNTLDKLFDQMDKWRHLPSYQLERRVDLFFSLYLKDIIKEKFEFDIKDNFIPEFPIRKGLLSDTYENDKNNRNRSFKIDYVAVSEDLKNAVIVELKTDNNSRNSKQDNYLEIIRSLDFKKWLMGVIELSIQKNSSKKYLCLLKQLEAIGQITIDLELTDYSVAGAMKHLRKNPDKIKITTKVEKTFLLYIQPSKEGFEKKDSINIFAFDDLIKLINNKDELSNVFAKYLKNWGEGVAGEPSNN